MKGFWSVYKIKKQYSKFCHAGSEYDPSKTLTETKAADAESSPIYFIILTVKVKQVEQSKDHCDALSLWMNRLSVKGVKR